MDFSILSSGYDTIVGFLSKLRDQISSSVNLLDLYNKVLESPAFEGDQLPDWTTVIHDLGYDVSEVANNIIPINNSDSVVSQYVNGIADAGVKFISLDDILTAAYNFYHQNSSTYLVPVYQNPEHPSSPIDAIPVQYAISTVVEQRDILENAVTAADSMLSAIEGGIEDVTLILEQATAGVTDGVKPALTSYLANILTTLNGKLSNEGTTSIIAAILGFFGFNIESSVNSNQIDGLYTNTSPANAWFGGFISWAAHSGYSASNWLQQHPLFVYEGIGYVIYGLFKLVAKGLSYVGYYTSLWTINTIVKVAGLSGALAGSNKSGDGTIGNAHAQIILPVGAIDQYDPGESHLLGDDYASMQSAYTVFTPGSKRLYTKSNNNEWTISIFWKPVNPFTVKRILDGHNIHLSHRFKTTGKGEGVGLIEADPDSNYTSITDSQWMDLYSDLTNSDLTFEEARIATNAAYAAGIFYAKFIDLLYIGVLNYKTNVDDLCENNQSNYSLQTFMSDYTSRTICVYNETGNFGNLWMVTYCCRLFDNGYPNSYDFFSDFSDTQGIISRQFTSYYTTNRAWLVAQLYPLIYLDHIKGTQGFWMSYLTRVSNAKPSYQVNNDTGVSWDAAKTLMIGVGVIAIAAAAYLGIRYVPKFIAYRRKIGMQLDTAAFNYGDVKTEEAYRAYNKLRRKAKLLGVTTTSAESILGSGVNLSSKIIESQGETDGTSVITICNKIGKSIKGNHF